MYISDLLMDLLPNIHLLGMFITVFTVVFRYKALIPIYIYVFILGVTYGFDMWWIPYMYIWAILWLFVMLIPKRIGDKAAAVVYPLVCAFHGFAFGTLYAPAQAFMMGLNFKQALAWIAAGIPFDLIHAGGNFLAGLLVLPLVKVLKKILKKSNLA